MSATAFITFPTNPPISPKISPITLDTEFITPVIPLITSPMIPPAPLIAFVIWSITPPNPD